MKKSAQHILITEFKINKCNLRNIADVLNRESTDREKSVYVAIDESAIIEIKSINNLMEIECILNTTKKALDEVKNKLISDVRRQILTLVDVVKDQDQSVPTTQYLQLRHIEVPLSLYDDYSEWRQRTIFQYVKMQPAIHSFVAYHSLISSEPGVMFLSGFNGEINDYQAGFESATYKEIVKEAGTKYISGGERGLYTTLYKRYQ